MTPKTGWGEGVLPDGWVQSVSPDDGRVFYTNLSDQTVHWELPALPSGWEASKTAEGKLLFTDHNTKTTQWEMPVIYDPIVAAQGGIDKYGIEGVEPQQLHSHVTKVQARVRGQLVRHPPPAQEGEGKDGKDKEGGGMDDVPI